MFAFLPCPLSYHLPLSYSLFNRKRDIHPNRHRRRTFPYITSQQSFHSSESVHDFVSDTTHVVLDSRDIPAVLDRLKSVEDDSELFFDEFLQQAEHHVDGTASPRLPSVSEAQQQVQITDYFHPDFLPFLPSWARQAFHADDTISLQSTEPLPHRRRLQDIVEQPAGITDCLLSDVAHDYNVPLEFIFDAVLALGVEPPITKDDTIKDTLNDKQIADLLRLLSSFDALDLSERYSDRSVKEMTDDYDLQLEYVMQACEGEGFHMCSGTRTRLSLVQEDRILDILLKDAPRGEPYPSPLGGLV